MTLVVALVAALGVFGAHGDQLKVKRQGGFTARVVLTTGKQIPEPEPPPATQGQWVWQPQATVPRTLVEANTATSAMAAVFAAGAPSTSLGQREAAQAAAQALATPLAPIIQQETVAQVDSIPVASGGLSSVPAAQAAETSLDVPGLPEAPAVVPSAPVPMSSMPIAEAVLGQAQAAALPPQTPSIGGGFTRGLVPVAQAQTASVPISGQARSMRDLTGDLCPSLCRGLQTTLSHTLPNVLIVGDHISQPNGGYFSVVEALLGKVAKVHSLGLFNVDHPDGIPLGVCGTSVGALACLDSWLGGEDDKWDVISFNWGLLDICKDQYAYVTATEYAERLRLMFNKMQRKLTERGQIIWQSTTPVPLAFSFRNNSDVIKFNSVAEMLFESMATNKPAIHDLYSSVVSACRQNVTTQCFPDSCDCPQLQHSTSVRFTPYGMQFLGMQVAQTISRVLQYRSLDGMERPLIEGHI